MIENVDYAAISSQFVIDIIGATAGNMEVKLTALRNHLSTNQPNARLTTYLYTPLVGVTSVTDPNGIITTYEYDAFGRLKAVRDHEGNLLSENKYNYRP